MFISQHNVLNPPQFPPTDSTVVSHCTTVYVSLCDPEATSVRTTRFRMNANPVKRPCEQLQYVLLFRHSSMFILVIQGPGGLTQFF